MGLALGALLAAGPTGDLLATLNELPPGSALLGPLAIALAATVALVAAASAWPALRATARTPVALLRGAELAHAPRPRRGRRLAGPLRLGGRLAAARRARYVGTVAVLGACVAIVALLLALASLLVALRDDPGTLGKRYDIAVALPADQLPAVERIPGVAAASQRYQVQGADSYSLGEPVRLIGFPGDHTVFEEPPLASGRRVAAPDEAEVGLGLADALNLRLGGTLAVAARVRAARCASASSASCARSRPTGGWPTSRPDRLLAAHADAAADRRSARGPAPTRRASTRVCARSAPRPSPSPAPRARTGRSSRRWRRCCGSSRSSRDSCASTRSCRA